MSYEIILWLHVLVMGYWIGSDLVVNQLTHYVTHAQTLPGAERTRLWDFLMDVDQHPRNALILSVPLGLTLAAMMGLTPLTANGLIVTWVLSTAWFVHMWIVHLKGHSPAGPALRRWDWRLRYLLIAACIVTGGWSLVTGWPFGAAWLAWKVILFGGVMSCGIGIRHYIRRVYELWPEIAADRTTDVIEKEVRVAMWRATYVLWGLWFLLFVIGWLGVVQPEF
jgi:hypothetical protein